jgi:hypothetical protein
MRNTSALQAGPGPQGLEQKSWSTTTAGPHHREMDAGRPKTRDQHDLIIKA